MQFRKSLLALTALGLGAVSQAQTQTVSFYFNVAGSPVTSQPGTIIVQPNSSVTLSVYLSTTNVGPTTSYGTLVGYTTTTGGAGFNATPIANGITPGATAFAPESAGALTNSRNAGASNTVGGVRTYGVNNESALIAGTFPSADATPRRLYDITLNVGDLAIGTVRPISMEADSSSQTFTNFVTTLNGSTTNYLYPNSRYVANLVVGSPVPEPASLAALGLGALALLRRRRASR
ncbi:PEP-CTERM sorting domain-containing protein [bacterium]|nr:MAG: PEP-CTERM sorting domain-containing protein [bacterium]